MATTAQWVGGAAGGGIPFLTSMYDYFAPRARRNRRESYRIEKARAAHGIASLEEGLATHLEESERERALMGQSLAGRGLSKSTIAKQDLARQQRLAARQEASLRRRISISQRGLALIRSRAKHEKRMEPFKVFSGLVGAASQGVQVGDMLGGL